ncbi:hydroxyacid oxidase 1-like [Patiria miniata]|uniref:FMN hydroxy acid dehydrogenase domain-containing protein n=1 Tax=Patiria miniata TaxID=46514 RepID=A0A913ZLT2_PATMI|nr:hydroxyacid oxidase 1-like [Patiria miniata]
MDLPKPVRLKDFEPFARRSLPATVYEYYRSGAYPEQTLRDNEHAFQRYRLRPGPLRDVSIRDLRTTLLGHEIAFPVAIAPTALHRLAHSDSELATVRAATSMGTGMVLSTYTSTPMEDVAAAASPNSLLWAQLTAYTDEEAVRRMIRKAEQNGFKAIVVSLDAKISKRKAGADLIPPHVRFANFEGARSQSFTTVERNANPKLTWDQIDWLSNLTTLPIVLKGVMSGLNAREARKHRVAGLWVSNQGGRALDGSLATGQEGVKKVLEIIRDEFSHALGLAECASPSDISQSLVVRDPYYTAKL